MTEPFLPGTPAFDRPRAWWERGTCYLIIASARGGREIGNEAQIA